MQIGNRCTHFSTLNACTLIMRMYDVCAHARVGSEIYDTLATRIHGRLRAQLEWYLDADR